MPGLQKLYERRGRKVYGKKAEIAASQTYPKAFAKEVIEQLMCHRETTVLYQNIF